jgi:short-chain fatty acids transporter
MSTLMNLLVPSAGIEVADRGAVSAAGCGRARRLRDHDGTACAYGDSSTNLIQPFWAIPLLAVTRLRLADVLGFTGIVALVCGIITVAAMLIIRAAL